MTKLRPMISPRSPLRRAPLLVIFIFGLAPIGCDRSERDLIDRARAAVNQSPPDFLGAQRLLDDALSRLGDSDSAESINMRREALTIRGMVFRSIGQLSAAESDFKNVLERIDPSDEGVLIQIATTLADRADEKSDDLDRAIHYGNLAFNIGKNSGARIATGMAHLKAARQLRSELRKELSGLQVGGDFKQFESMLTKALAHPASDPISISLERDLDELLRLRTTDIRAKIGEKITNARNHYIAGRRDLLDALGRNNGVDIYLMQHALMILNDLHQYDDALLLVRHAVKLDAYWRIPFVLDEITRVTANAGFPSEAAGYYLNYLERGMFELDFPSRVQMIEYAIQGTDNEILEKTITKLRAALRRDPFSQILSKFIDYSEAVLMSRKGTFSNEEIAEKAAVMVSARPPELSKFIPEAAVFACDYYRKANKNADALRIIEIGYSNNQEYVPAVSRRALLMAEQNQDPIAFGRYARFSIAHDPENSEEYYKVLRTAADRLITKMGQSFQKVIDDTVLRGSTIPNGFTDGWVYYVLSREFFEREYFEQASLCAIEALTRDAELRVANIFLGLSRARLGQFAAAREAFVRIMDRFPKDPELLRRVAECGAAPPDLQVKLLMTRPDVEGRLVLAESYRKLGDWEHAVSVLAPLANTPGVPDDVYLKAANLLFSKVAEPANTKRELDEAAIEQYLLKIPTTSPAYVAANQMRFEIALFKNQYDDALALTEKLSGHPKELNRDRLLKAHYGARYAGYGRIASLASKLLLNEQTETDVELLKSHGLAQLEAELPSESIATLDRLSGITSDLDSSILLGLALSFQGDSVGLRSALTQLRLDWGIVPNDYRRASVAAMGGETITPSEIAGLAISIDRPIAALATACVLYLHDGAAGFEKELQIDRSSRWFASLDKAARQSKTQANRLLRIVLSLSVSGGGPLALHEIAEWKKNADSPDVEALLTAQAFLQIPTRAAECLSAFQRVAEYYPMLDYGWTKALELAIQSNNTALANSILQKWKTSKDKSKTADASIQFYELSVALAPSQTKESLKELSDNIKKFYQDKLQTVAVLELRCAVETKLDNKVEAIAAARQLLELIEKNPATVPPSSIPVICSALEIALPDHSREATETAKRLKKLAPSAVEPVLLLAMSYLTTSRFSDAADEILTLLRLNEKEASISTSQIERFIRVIAPSDPVAAAEIASASVASQPGDWKRWQLFVESQDAIGRTEVIVTSLEGLYKITPSAEIRSLLAELSSDPEINPLKAIEILSNGPATASASRPAFQPKDAHDATILSKALRITNQPAAAVTMLESRIGAVNDIGPTLKIESAYSAAIPAAFKSATNFGEITELGLAYAFRGLKGDLAKAYACLAFVKNTTSDKRMIERTTELCGAVEHLRRLYISPAEYREAAAADGQAGR